MNTIVLDSTDSSFSESKIIKNESIFIISNEDLKKIDENPIIFQEVEQKKTFQIEKPFIFHKYHFFSYNTYSWRGKRTHFQLNSIENLTLFHTKIKSTLLLDQIFISKGNECHFSDKNHEGIIYISQDKKSFSLRILDNEIMTIRFIFSPDKNIFPINLNFFNLNENLPILLNSKNPIFNKEKNKWLIDFNGRILKYEKSKKNYIIIDQGNNEWIVIIKNDHNSIFIEASSLLNPIMIFSIGIGIFLFN